MSEENAAESKLILVADDIDINRKVLKRILVAQGHDVVLAGNGYEAISVFEAERPDLVLMDINMPDMDGREAAGRIKELTEDDYIPIIFVTALTGDEELTVSLDSGGDDFISKPVNADVLKAKMAAHLRIQELNTQLNEKNQQLVDYNTQLEQEQDLVEHFFNKALEQNHQDPEHIKFHMSAMSVFNGDILLVEKKNDGGLVVLTGDFTGHGLTAAMGTLPVTHVFFNMVNSAKNPGELARHINKALSMLMPTGMFLTACITEFSADGKQVYIWAGGLPEGYWFSESGEFKDCIHSDHLPLGILDDASFEEEFKTLDVLPADKFYFYSDGVTELENSAGEMFGDDRLRDVLMRKDGERFENVLIAMEAFRDDAESSDDTTFVELTCK